MHNVSSVNHVEMKRQIASRSASLGHKKGSAGWAIKEALLELVDKTFADRVVTGPGRAAVRNLHIL